MGDPWTCQKLIKLVSKRKENMFWKKILKCLPVDILRIERSCDELIPSTNVWLTTILKDLDLQTGPRTCKFFPSYTLEVGISLQMWELS